MERLEFSFSDIDAEITAITEVTSRFIDTNSTYVFDELKRTLNQIRRCPSGHSHQWGIAERQPLRTITSYGDYEPGDRMGENNVFAQITSTWEVEPLGSDNIGSQPHRRFALAGTASTKVCLLKAVPENQSTELAMWRMEIGDENSPGCHFHVQILGEKSENDDPPFPHSLSIPRLPGLLVTPMAVVEFVLGELFQDRWRRHASRETYHMQQWRSIQRKRLGRLLDWQSEQVKKTPGCPWTELKWAKPPADLFLES